MVLKELIRTRDDFKTKNNQVLYLLADEMSIQDWQFFSITNRILKDID